MQLSHIFWSVEKKTFSSPLSLYTVASRPSFHTFYFWQEFQLNQPSFLNIFLLWKAKPRDAQEQNPALLQNLNQFFFVNVICKL